MFKTNEGSLDRGLRILAGLVMLALFFLYPEASWRNWMLIGVVPIFTGAVGWCPLYSVFGWSTCSVRKS